MSAPADDREALEILERHGVLELAGMIAVPEGQHYPQELWAAITYLCDEWDYDWSWQP